VIYMHGKKREYIVLGRVELDTLGAKMIGEVRLQLVTAQVIFFSCHLSLFYKCIWIFRLKPFFKQIDKAVQNEGQSIVHDPQMDESAYDDVDDVLYGEGRRKIPK